MKLTWFLLPIPGGAESDRRRQMLNGPVGVGLVSTSGGIHVVVVVSDLAATRNSPPREDLRAHMSHTLSPCEIAQRIPASRNVGWWVPGTN
jgi:hypothetical protein